MASTRTSKLKLEKPGFADRNWHLALNANADALDAVAPIGGLAVTLAENPSASLNVSVAAGRYIKSDGTVGAHAGTASQAISASSTKYLYLDSGGTLTVGAAFPSAGTAYFPLATVVAGSSTITSITDSRIAITAVGAAGATALPLAGGTMNDGADIAVGTSTGTKIGTSASQKLGFFGKTPIARPASSAQAAITDSTTGTAGTTLANVTGSHSQSILNNNFATLANLVNEMRNQLVALGLMKGSS